MLQKLIKQIIFDLISLFYVKKQQEQQNYKNILNEIVKELWKEAKKEIYLKN